MYFFISNKPKQSWISYSIVTFTLFSFICFYSEIIKHRNCASLLLLQLLVLSDSLLSDISQSPSALDRWKWHNNNTQIVLKNIRWICKFIRRVTSFFQLACALTSHQFSNLQSKSFPTWNLKWIECTMQNEEKAKNIQSVHSNK